MNAQDIVATLLEELPERQPIPERVNAFIVAHASEMKYDYEPSDFDPDEEIIIRWEQAFAQEYPDATDLEKTALSYELQHLRFLEV